MPMPPWPSSSMISSSGKYLASAAGGGALPSPPYAAVSADPAGAWLPIPNANRHFGHIPSGASAGSSLPHCGQCLVSLIKGSLSQVAVTSYLPECRERLQRFSEAGCIGLPSACSPTDDTRSPFDRREQIAQLLVDLGRVRQRLSDLLAEQFTAAAAQPVHGGLDGRFAHVQAFCRLGIGHTAAVAGQEDPQCAEQRAFGPSVFAAQL